MQSFVARRRDVRRVRGGLQDRESGMRAMQGGRMAIGCCCGGRRPSGNEPVAACGRGAAATAPAC